METYEPENKEGYFSDYVGEVYERPDQYSDECSSLVEVKVSDDRGETWIRRLIDMVDLNDSGLKAGELFQFNGEKFKVLDGEDGLIIEPLKKQVRENNSTKKR